MRFKIDKPKLGKNRGFPITGETGKKKSRGKLLCNSFRNSVPNINFARDYRILWQGKSRGKQANG
jgi:hypothetical protein